MAASLLSPPADAGVQGASAMPMSPPKGATGGWLLGPWYDAFLIANVCWPLLLLLQVGEGFSGREGLQFWQIYFVTTPHRWITLALVFLDRERFGQRRAAFVSIAALIAAVCLGVRMTTGTLTCLLTIDYVWNAWHFAAQHHGIYRIYERRSDTALLVGPAIEKWAMRSFLLYVILRVAGATWSHFELERGLRAMDWIVMAVPVSLLARDVLKGGRALPRTLYLVSVMALYVSMLAAVHANRPTLVLSLAIASALFHATEYLAVVSWSVDGRYAAAGRRLGILSHIVPRWGLALGAFVLVLGAGGWLLDQHLMNSWLSINLLVAFLHYAYDGMIWQRGARA